LFGGAVGAPENPRLTRLETTAKINNNDQRYWWSRTACFMLKMFL